MKSELVKEQIRIKSYEEEIKMIKKLNDEELQERLEELNILALKTKTKIIAVESAIKNRERNRIERRNK